MRLPLSFFTCLILALGAAALQASEIEVTVGSSLLTPGGPVDYLPVYLQTDTGTVNLAATSFEFEITKNGSTAVQFVGSPAPASDPTFASPNYVFSGASGDLAFGVPLGTAPSTSTFTGADEANNANFYVSLTTTPKLLGMLPLTTLTNTAPPLGDPFSVSLVPYSTANPTTLFTDNNGNSVPITPGSFAAAQVNVAPEPSAWVLAMLGAASLAAGRRWRRKV